MGWGVHCWPYTPSWQQFCQLRAPSHYLSPVGTTYLVLCTHSVLWGQSPQPALVPFLLRAWVAMAIGLLEIRVRHRVRSINAKSKRNTCSQVGPANPLGSPSLLCREDSVTGAASGSLLSVTGWKMALPYQLCSYSQRNKLFSRET